MAEFCNQCARELGLPEGDLAVYWAFQATPRAFEELCEGCGRTVVNQKGECVSAYCTKEHGKL